MKKVAVITGAGTGIGKAVAIRLAKDGYKIAICYATSQQGANDVLQEIVSGGGEAELFQVLIQDEQSVKQLFKNIYAAFKRIDVLINNAGVGHYGEIKDVSMEDFDRIFGVNTRGTFMMCREAVPLISDKGKIINISSGITTSNPAGQSLYVASKIAMEGFTKVLAKELGARGINVNTVSPGMTDTPLLGEYADQLKAYGAKTAALQRCGQPDDLAAFISVLVSEDAAWVTGQTLHVDGGSVII